MTQKDKDQTLEVVYTCIRAYIVEYGYPPSLREISDCCYLGRTTVLRYLDKLEAKGRLARANGKARSITLTEPLQSPRGNK